MLKNFLPFFMCVAPIAVANAANYTATSISYPTDYTEYTLDITGYDNATVTGNVWNNSSDGQNPYETIFANNVQLTINVPGAVSIGGDIVNYGGRVNMTGGSVLTHDIKSYSGEINLASKNGAMSVGNVLLSTAGVQSALQLKIDQSGTGGITMGSLNISSPDAFGAINAASFINVTSDIAVNSASLTGTNFTAKGGAITVGGNVTNSGGADLSLTATAGITAGNVTNNTGKLNLSAGANQSVSFDKLTSNVGGAVNVSSGREIIIGSGGLTLGGGLFTGFNTGGTGGDLYWNGADNDLTMRSTGAINIVGNIKVADTKSLLVASLTTAGQYASVTTGAIINSGTLKFSDNAAFTAGSYGLSSVTVNGNINSSGVSTRAATLDIYTSDNGTGTNNITAGAVDNGAYSVMNLVADDGLLLNSFINSNVNSRDVLLYAKNGNVVINGAANSGFLTNMATGAAQMVVKSGSGFLSVADSINNNGSYMQIITPAGVTVDGSLTNSLSSGKLLIGTDGVFASGVLATTNAVSGLTVNGGDATNASMVNKGTFMAVVSGQTLFKWGVDQTAVAKTGQFYLDTGTLVFGNPDGTNGYSSFYTNYMNDYYLRVRNGGITTNDVINGAVALNLTSNASANMALSAQTVTVNGSVVNVGNNLTMNSAGDIDISGDIWNQTKNGTLKLNNGGSANSKIIAGDVLTIGGSVENFATLELSSANGLGITGADNFGKMQLLTGVTAGKNITISGGLTNSGLSKASCSGAGCDLYVNGYDLDIADTYANKSGNAQMDLTRNASFGAISMDGGYFAVRAPGAITVDNGITQTSGSMYLNTKRLTVSSGGISSAGGVYLTGDNLVMDITGDISGGVKITGLSSMDVTGNYTLSDASMLAVVLTDNSHNATVSLADPDFGTITNGTATAMVNITGQFISDLSTTGVAGAGGKPMSAPGIGLTIYDMVDAGTAVWLAHASGGIQDKGFWDTAYLSVKFCNASGTMCFNYLDPNGDGSNNPNDLPAYLALRDSYSDGVNDDVYIVFDSQVAGWTEIFKIQPKVGLDPAHTRGEWDSAGALDQLIASMLEKNGFYNRAPTAVISTLFSGTNMEQAADELLARMDQYDIDQDNAMLTSFSRLFQPRETEQLIHLINLNDHAFRLGFESRMLDEFTWNRKRRLKKAWADFEYSVFDHSSENAGRIDGNRFSFTGGYDWQDSEDIVLGLSLRIAYGASDATDRFDLGYGGTPIAGRVDTNASDTVIGVGGYMMKVMSTNLRLYGNAFLDLHLLDVTRDQNYVDRITGSATTAAITTEWGLMHNIFSEYFVGNLYARAGYNFGFDISADADGSGYMQIDKDGSFLLTPGYSLNLQKRMYLTSWFQLRPRISAGVEYDLLGLGGDAEYRFARADGWTKYNVTEIDPLWVNFGGGIEFIDVSGWQAGLDYKYQYNPEMQVHNFRLFGTYRF